MSGLEERERAVGLCFTTPMTTAQVVEHLGYPTRQCLERWLAMDSRYAGHMAKPIIPLETRRRAVELVLGGMQQKQAAKQLGVSVGAVHGWVRAYRKGGMAALQPKNRNSAQGNKPADSRRWPSAADDDDAEALRRRVEELELENALMREVAEVVKRPRRRPAAPVEQGEDPVDRPVEAGVFARLDDMPARHRAQRPPTATTPGSALTSTPDSGQRWPGRSPIPRAGTGTAGSRRCSRPAYRRSRSAGSWRRKGSWRMCPSDAGIVPTRARRRRLPPISSTGTSRPSVRTRNGPRTSPGIKARDGKGVPFAAGRLLRWVDPQGYVWSCINGVGLSPYREGPFANRNSWEWKLARARRLESVAPAFPMCKTCKFLPVCGGGCAYRNESIHPTCLRSIFENNELRILKEHLAKEYSYNCKTNMK